jgi:membrane-associated protease RseP (regulator of RpoE activity)
MTAFLLAYLEMLVRLWLFMHITIAVHEGGHALAAVLRGLHVMEFSVGVGPGTDLQLGRTRYSFGFWPTGGYVWGSDPDNPGMSSRIDHILVTAGGPAANLVAGVAAWFLLPMSWGWLLVLTNIGATVVLLTAGQDGYELRREIRILRRNRLIGQAIDEAVRELLLERPECPPGTSSKPKDD